MTEATPRRILVKISGEMFSDAGLRNHEAIALAQAFLAIKKTGVEVGVMVGGGNFARGKDLIPGSHNRHMMHIVGMTGTIMNALLLQDRMFALGADPDSVRVMSSLEFKAACEPFYLMKALSHLRRGRTIIYASGMGKTGLTTDTAAIHRAMETDCDLVIKATKVDGVFSSDPKINPRAKMYERLTFAKAIAMRLKIMDLTAFTLCQENNLPVAVCNGNALAKNIIGILNGESIGTMITN